MSEAQGTCFRSVESAVLKLRLGILTMLYCEPCNLNTSFYGTFTNCIWLIHYVLTSLKNSKAFFGPASLNSAAFKWRASLDFCDQVGVELDHHYQQAVCATANTETMVL